MKVLAHPTDFLPQFKKLSVSPGQNKGLLEAIINIKQELEKSERPLGIHHRYSNIPKRYFQRYGLQNLYHFDTPGDFRLIYTVRKSPSTHELEALFLELLSHDEYNKLFGYFKKKSH